MSTRVTSAIVSRKARENLVRLLFPSDHLVGTTSNRSAPSPILTPHARDTDRHNHSSRRRQRQEVGGTTLTEAGADHKKKHTYSQLRTAYLQLIHEMHPDKNRHKEQVAENPTQHDNGNRKSPKEDAHIKFIELKDAWEEYHKSVRIVQKHTDGTTTRSKKEQSNDDDYWEEEDNFTMFGVGCSFADSPEERDLRNEIMEQACRGWFSSGSISITEIDEQSKSREGTENVSLLQDSADTKQTSQYNAQSTIKLTDDDMFVSDDVAEITKEEDTSKRKYLIPDASKFVRKR